MDIRKHHTYAREFKLEALSLLESSGKNALDLERKLGITTGQLSQLTGRVV